MRTNNQAVSQNLLTFRDYAADKSVNSWGHIFYAGVIADTELMQHLETGTLPDFL